MICPKCKSENNTVRDTRKYPDTVRRVRECDKCDYLWVTWEVEQKQIVVLQHPATESTKSPNTPI